MELPRKKKIIFLVTHPIQYYSPLFQLMAKNTEIDLLVLYCSDENVKGHIDKGFGVEVKWDIPLLEGYTYQFLKNKSWKPSIFNGFFGLINPAIIRLLKNEKESILIVQGWNYFTHIIAILAGKLFGLTVCIRGDNPYNQEMLKNNKLLLVKKLLLGKILFKFIDHFLYVGKQNRKFYNCYKVPEEKLIFTPHSVDNNRFRADYEKYKDKKPELRKELGLPADKKIILFAGKYITKKRPMDLLQAYHSLNDEKAALVFLGDGELRKELQEYISKINLKDVYLTGFKNQSEVGKYFAAVDIFVLPSGGGETWGLVVNEAMNFGLPIIISDQVGCAIDMVINDENGFIFECGNINKLTEKIRVLAYSDLNSYSMNSLKMIEQYSYDQIIYGLMQIK